MTPTNPNPTPVDEPQKGPTLSRYDSLEENTINLKQHTTFCDFQFDTPDETLWSEYEFLNDPQLLTCQLLLQYFVLSEYFRWFRNIWATDTHIHTVSDKNTVALSPSAGDKQTLDYHFRKLSVDIKRPPFTGRLLISDFTYLKCTHDGDTVCSLSHFHSREKCIRHPCLHRTAQSRPVNMSRVRIRDPISEDIRIASEAERHCWVLKVRLTGDHRGKKTNGIWMNGGIFQYFCSTSFSLYPLDWMSKNH